MKNLLMIFVAIVALLFVSCEKEEEKLIPPAVKKISIFTSLAKNNNLKSASTLTEIENGDTISCQKGIKSLIWAITSGGLPVEGKWEMTLVESDFTFPQNQYEWNYVGDQITPSFDPCGIYKITFKKYIDQDGLSYKVTFYALVEGLPGKTGDEKLFNNIFRIESRQLWNVSLQKTETVIFAYFKYADTSILPEQAMCELKTIAKDPYLLSFALKKWEYSQENYYYFQFVPRGDALYYEAHFLIKDAVNNWFIPDINNALSEFTKFNDYITFSVQ